MVHIHSGTWLELISVPTLHCLTDVHYPKECNGSQFCPLTRIPTGVNCTQNSYDRSSVRHRSANHNIESNKDHWWQKIDQADLFSAANSRLLEFVLVAKIGFRCIPWDSVRQCSVGTLISSCGLPGVVEDLRRPILYESRPRPTQMYGTICMLNLNCAYYLLLLYCSLFKVLYLYRHFKTLQDFKFLFSLFCVEV
jgi:hypothetical protein